MVGLATGHGHLLHHAHHHPHLHGHGHGLCTHCFKMRLRRLHRRFPISILSTNSPLSYSVGSAQSIRISPAYLALYPQRKHVSPRHGRFVRVSSNSEDSPVLASQGEDTEENVFGSSDQYQVPIPAPLRNVVFDINSDDNVNKTPTNSISSKKKSSRMSRKDEIPSDARKPKKGGFELGNGHDCTNEMRIEDYNAPAQNLHESGEILTTQFSAKDNLNSSMVPTELTEVKYYEEDKRSQLSSKDGVKQDSIWLDMITSEMSEVLFKDTEMLPSQLSTRKVNLDCSNLNKNGRNSTKIRLEMSDGLNDDGRTSSSTMISSEMPAENLCEIGKTTLSQLSTNKINLDSNNANQNAVESTSKMPSGMSGSNSVEISTSSSSATDECESTLAHLLASKNPLEFIVRFPAWADAQKESGMPQRQKRAFFSHEDWLQHRSTLRYVRHMLTSPSSRVIVSLVPPVFTFTVCAIIIAAYNSSVDSGLFPSFFPLLHASSLPYELTAPALALLLVFRTDASYSRYDEARKTWTNVISVTKDFSRQSAQLITRPEDQALKSTLLSYILAFPVALKCHLINGSDMRKELQVLLDKDDLAFVLASKNRPNCLIQLMSRVLALVQLENTEKILLEGNIVQFNASFCVCERLIRTPIPLSYTRLTSRFLVLWHTSLPIVLWDSCNWLVVPATFLSSTMLFYIEEVGVLIEEPFPMLALDKIIGVAHKNIHELIGLQQEADDFLISKKKGSELIK